jgi:ferritin-like metal-binding protein YciE
MPYKPKDPLTDAPRQPDSLRRLNRAHDNCGATLLEETLEEEKATDEALTKIAESVVNHEAQSVAAE